MDSEKKFQIQDRKIYSKDAKEVEEFLQCERCGTNRPNTRFQLDHLSEGRFRRRTKCKTCPDQVVSPIQKREKHSYKEIMATINKFQKDIDSILITIEDHSSSITALRKQQDKLESKEELPGSCSETNSCPSDG